jgi:hypothetical protein
MTSSKLAWRGLCLGLVLILGLLAVPRAEPQTQQPLRPPLQPVQQPLQPKQTVVAPKVTPRLEPVAETRLIMEGVAHTNFRGLERLLTERPNDTRAWTFARGQALLLAETANLLMLRPPKNQGQAVWFERSMALRESARELAQAVGARDFDRGKAGLLKVSAVCNSCHQSFRVQVQITPFAQPAVEKVKFGPNDL